MTGPGGVILLDVDGVLNPTVQMDQLVITEHRAELVREFAALGELVWATTWSAAHTWRLAQSIGLDADPAAIAFPAQIHADGRNPAPTPKLHWVSRWIARNLTEYPQQRPLVWIDDHLGPDAREWAATLARPILLISPSPATGLQGAHVEQVDEFLGQHRPDVDEAVLMP